MLLSKKPYCDWREIQKEYADYLTSLGPWTLQELLEFFRIDFGEDETRWPFSPAQMEDFMQSEAQILRLEPAR